MAKLNDDSLMPFGEYEGAKLEDVPAWYLLHLLTWKNVHPIIQANYIDVEEYVLENEDLLIQERDRKSR